MLHAFGIYSTLIKCYGRIVYITLIKGCLHFVYIIVIKSCVHFLCITLIETLVHIVNSGLMCTHYRFYLQLPTSNAHEYHMTDYPCPSQVIRTYDVSSSSKYLLQFLLFVLE